MTIVKEIMSTNVFSVLNTQDLNFTEVMAEAKHIRHIPVVDESYALVGMLSSRDILQHLSKAGASHFIPVQEIMATNVITATSTLKVKELAQRMLEYNVSSIPIVDENKLVGIVSERDIVKLYAENA